MNKHKKRRNKKQQAERREKMMNKSVYDINYDSFKDNFNRSNRILSKVRIPIQ